MINQNTISLVVDNRQKKILKYVFFFLAFFSISVYATDEEQAALDDISKVSANVHIDASLPDANELHKSTTTSTEIFHLFSHGRPGELFINGQWKDAKAIALWFTENTLTSNFKYINIYGCNFAKGEKGLHAVSYLEEQLGVSVSASTNITGKDGDWDLEVGSSNFTVSPTAYAYNLQCAGNSGSCSGFDHDSDGIADKNEAIQGTNRCRVPLGTATATQISTGGSNTADLGIDGVTNTASLTANTAGGTTGDWWMVDLGASYDIATLRFYNISEFFGQVQRRKIALCYLMGSNTPFPADPTGDVAASRAHVVATGGFEYQFPPAGSITGGSSTDWRWDIDLPTPLQPMRYFKIQKSGTNNGNDLRVMEFQAFEARDLDDDGTPDYLDLDSDADGCNDMLETATNAYEYSLLSSTDIALIQGSGASVSLIVGAIEQVTTVFNSGTPDLSGDPGDETATINYQWYDGDPNGGGMPVTDTGVFSGATTNRLDISDVSGNTAF